MEEKKQLRTERIALLLTRAEMDVFLSIKGQRSSAEILREIFFKWMEDQIK